MSEKKAYQEKVEATLNQLDARIDLLKAQAKEASAEAKIEYNKRLEDLREQQSEVRARLQEMSEAGEEAWEEFKDGIDEAVSELQDAVTGALAAFE